MINNAKWKYFSRPVTFRARYEVDVGFGIAATRHFLSMLCLVVGSRLHGHVCTFMLSLSLCL